MRGDRANASESVRSGTPQGREAGVGASSTISPGEIGTNAATGIESGAYDLHYLGISVNASDTTQTAPSRTYMTRSMLYMPAPKAAPVHGARKKMPMSCIVSCLP